MRRAWLEKFDKDFAVHIQEACEPANHRHDNHVWDRHLYGFVRREPEDERLQRRQPGIVVRDEGIFPLFTVIALSRLIRPTTTGNRYCAKIYPQPVSDPPIQALLVSGANPDVTIGDGSQDWLSPDDGVELRQLMPWVSINKTMHQRVHRAFWNHEEAMRTYYLDMRWNLVVSGLEALINVEQDYVRRQFVSRVRQLAIECGVNLSETELHSAYTVRSSLAHAQSFLFGLHTVLPPDKHRPLYDKLETLLRMTVKRCLLDTTFGDTFSDGTAVKARWG